MSRRFRLTGNEPSIQWFHLGADLPSNHVNAPAIAMHPASEVRQRVLMVGTIEPRKGHTQALDAFDLLWRNGVDATLIIAGKQGWDVEPFIERMKSHPEANNRLFWLQDINDAQLIALYADLDGLMMASEAEGFGLPLVEAAQYGMPMFIRDLPVFREVAGEHATYFAAQSAAELAPQLAKWLGQLERGMAPPSHAMKSLTWSASSEQLKALIADIDVPR
ncbi:hypothetical protein R75461_06982 [Paraburkholderia nemoris]|nr:hypothetical protein R75461_06982 [Paraburkholderia nemoris]